MKDLYPKDLKELARIKKEFSEKPTSEQESHQHTWEKVSIPAQPGFGAFNKREAEVCFGCGEMKIK